MAGDAAESLGNFVPLGLKRGWLLKRSYTSWLADGALFLVALGWGFNFVVIKWTLGQMTPFYYLALRFALSLLVMLLIAGRRLTGLSRREWRNGLIIGLFLFGAFATQTVGLQYTTPGKSGFITGLNVVLVPLLQWGLSRRFPGYNALVGAVLATAGLGLLSLNGSLHLALGDLLTLICALLYAGHIVAISKLGRGTDPLALAVLQIGVAAAGNVVMALLLEPAPTGLTAFSAGSIVYGALVGTVLAFSVQTAAQRLTPPSHTAVILSAEAMFAGLFSILLWGEAVTARSLLAAGLILGGIITAELRSGNPAEVPPVEMPV
ncbi:MAG: DMT family transporter [Firmicutes bacterium]|nr:DMT family transporter [Bacillota bacterium]